MNQPLEWNLNQPFFKSPAQRGHQEVWYMKFNDVKNGRALWLRFTLLLSNNGFKHVAETWGIWFERLGSGEITKSAFKQTHDIAQFTDGGGRIEIGESSLSANHTQGRIQSKGSQLQWNLQLSGGPLQTSVNYVPEILSRLKIVKNTVLTPWEDLRVSGSVIIGDRTVEFNDAPGTLGHLAGPKNGHSWAWAHCNTFILESGEPVPFLFEGLTARSKLPGGIPSPAMSSFFFNYKGEEFRFQSLKDAFMIKSKRGAADWEFVAERGDITFRGFAKAENKDFAGVTYEDTDGSLLYCSNSKLSQLRILVYRRGKLEVTLQSAGGGSAAFEVVTREKNSYVEVLI